MDVLLIEPDLILAKTYKEVLENNSLRVSIVSDAESAVYEIDRKAPQVIVLELQLAKYSGIDFLHEFKTYEDWHDIPVIVYSRIPKYTFEKDEVDWSKYGVRRYLEKSRYTATELANFIKREI